MSTKLGMVVAGICVLHAGAAGAGHHSFAAEYDGSTTFKVTGIVSKMEWTNPHARFYVDVREPDGTVTTWNMELASPSALVRNGWTRQTLKVGDRVTVDGYPGKVVRTRGNPRSVITADGRSLFAGPVDDPTAPGTQR
ncbi:MAG: hypothetical protein HYU37_06430 [Acidobacteria bacterium]|nr:hypothetical protein [Acidobacteriota bacterium]